MKKYKIKFKTSEEVFSEAYKLGVTQGLPIFRKTKKDPTGLEKQRLLPVWFTNIHCHTGVLCEIFAKVKAGETLTEYDYNALSIFIWSTLKSARSFNSHLVYYYDSMIIPSLLLLVKETDNTSEQFWQALSRGNCLKWLSCLYLPLKEFAGIDYLTLFSPEYFDMYPTEVKLDSFAFWDKSPIHVHFNNIYKFWRTAWTGGVDESTKTELRLCHIPLKLVEEAVGVCTALDLGFWVSPGDSRPSTRAAIAWKIYNTFNIHSNGLPRNFT